MGGYSRGTQQSRSLDNVLERRVRLRMRDRKPERDGTGEVKVALSMSGP